MENITQIWKKIQSPEFNPATDMGLVEQVKQVALTSQESAKVSFGTSGWRGEIGSEFTLRNLQVVGAAIVRLYKEATPELFEALGVKDFAELQKRGVVVGHDNRLLGHEFCEAHRNARCRLLHQHDSEPQPEPLQRYQVQPG